MKDNYGRGNQVSWGIVVGIASCHVTSVLFQLQTKQWMQRVMLEECELLFKVVMNEEYYPS